VLVRLAEIWLQSPCFHISLFVKQFCKFYTFNAIRKDDAAIDSVNCITVQHRSGSFPSAVTGHNARLVCIMTVSPPDVSKHPGGQSGVQRPLCVIFTRSELLS
jgi:hypothetical protein